MKKELTLKEIHSIELEMMDVIHNFCVTHHIRYSLGGGTLLGAVRHKGFIPWDDDMDIMMPRPDYERFLRDFEGFHSYYKLQHLGNQSHYIHAFAKVYDDRTILFEDFLRSGVFIDIFPVDGLPSIDGLDSYLNLYIEYRLEIYRNTNLYKINPNLKTFIKTVFNKIVYHGDRNVAIASLDKLLKSHPFETSRYCGAITGAYAKKEHMEASVFKSFVNLEFENRQYSCIEAYDNYLRKHYGNYMELPPVEKRITHHKLHAYWK